MFFIRNTNKPESASTLNCLKAGESDIRGGVPRGSNLDSLKPCCAGLKEIDVSVIYDSSYGCIASVGGYGYGCAPCGNGKCESNYGENKCNCPADCK